MTVKNSFLNDLERRNLDLDKIFIISGSGVYTNKEILVDINHREKIKWKDGKPIKSYKTDYGDGTVTTTSTLGYLGKNKIVLKGNHTNILYSSKDYLGYIL